MKTVTIVFLLLATVVGVYIVSGNKTTTTQIQDEVGSSMAAPEHGSQHPL